MSKNMEKQDSNKEKKLFYGSVNIESSSNGLLHPSRFFPAQIEYLRKINKQYRALATSGIAIKFLTNASKISFDTEVVYDFDESDPAYALVNYYHKGDGLKNSIIYDGVDLLVDERYVRTYNPSISHIEIQLENNKKQVWRNVCIYLPYIMSVNIGNFKCDGELLMKPHSSAMLALGDSITQGFFVGHPSASYPEMLASELGINLINQAIAGNGFDKNTLCSIEKLKNEVKVILIAYGTNDWSHKLTAASIASDAYEYLKEVARIFPDTPAFVLSPIWRADEKKTVPSNKSFRWITEMLSDICKDFSEMKFIDGYDIVPHDTIFFADGRLHPGPNGAKFISDYVLSEIMKGLSFLVSPKDSYDS